MNDKKWRLILVGDRGDIIPLGALKFLLVSLILVICLTVIGAGTIGILYLQQKVKYSALLQELDQSKSQLEVLKDKRDVLMAQLVIAESKLPSHAKAEEKNSTSVETKSSQQETKSLALEQTSQEEKRLASQGDAFAGGPPPVSVEISNFNAALNNQTHTIIATCNIKNTTEGGERIGGRCVLLLKGTINGETTIYPIPNVPWEDGKPSAKYGRPFFIRNFMTIQLSRRAPQQSFVFDRGILYVFENSGAVLLKKEIPIQLNFVEKPATPQTKTSSKKNNSKDSDNKADIKSDAKVDTTSDEKTDTTSDAKVDTMSDEKADTTSDEKVDIKSDVKADTNDAAPVEAIPQPPISEPEKTKASP